MAIVRLVPPEPGRQEEQEELIERAPVLKIIDARNAEIEHMKRKLEETSSEVKALYRELDFARLARTQVQIDMEAKYKLSLYIGGGVSILSAIAGYFIG